jgi:hypothetical protein
MAVPRHRLRVLSGPNQRATTITERTKSVGGICGLQQFVVVKRTTALFRLLYLEKIGRVQFPTICTDSAGTEGIIICRHRLHAGNRLRATGLGGPNAYFSYRLEVVQNRRVLAGLDHAQRYLPGNGACALCKGASAVIQVPVEGFRTDKALSGLQAQCMHIRQELRTAERKSLRERLGSLAAAA